MVSTAHQLLISKKWFKARKSPFKLQSYEMGKLSIHFNESANAPIYEPPHYVEGFTGIQITLTRVQGNGYLFLRAKEIYSKHFHCIKLGVGWHLVFCQSTTLEYVQYRVECCIERKDLFWAIHLNHRHTSG